MDTDSHFSASRAKKASPARRSPPVLEALLDKDSLEHWPDLRRTLRQAPAVRPEAVARAKQLIADPDYPSQLEQKILARHLAAQLRAGINRHPTGT
jgi:hypothetical protein